ncbi:MAG: sugar phosphate nucleotidyltransferase [Bacteroidota bacterium]|nr:sugar phosphate nucleotidyltransferase [Bacteroidota bacterium]
MNIIIPMAGMGKRMRPHTLTVPKPLLPVAGKPIVQRLVEDLAKESNEKIEEIAFVVGRFGLEAEQSLISIAESLGAKGKIFYQDEPLGTGHAILCAAESLKGNVIVAFADTLFVADIKIDRNLDGVIWVNHVKNPEQFGVVKMGEDGFISDMIEKPKDFVSDMAIIGIYYFKDGENLRTELQYLIDNNIKEKGEYQLTNALANMKNKGLKFAPAAVTEWLDCGNYQSTVFTNQRVLENKRNETLLSPSAKLVNSIVIEPSYIGHNVVIENSVVGPYASVGDNCKVSHSVISNSIIQSNTLIEYANICNSMIGNNVHYKGPTEELSLGDYSILT